MDKNNAWFFGDSFTYGHGLHDDDEYVKLYPHLKNKLWSELLCDNYGWTYNNLGRPGASSQYILMTIIENLHKFRKNDVVFISDTTPVRTETVSLYGEHQYPIIAPTTNEVFAYNPKTNNTVNDVSKLYSGIPKSKIPHLVDYVYSFVLDYEETWELYWISAFKNIQKHLLSNDIKCYIWSHRMWTAKRPEYNFSSIVDETNGVVNDGHWGWKGQEQMYNHMMTRINNMMYFNPNEFYKVNGIWNLH